MKYSEIREELQSGDIIIFSHYRWASWYDLQVMAVRLFSLTDYTHVGVVVKLGGRVFLAESVSPVVRLVPLSNFVEDSFYVIPTRNLMTEVETEYLLSKVGKGKYSKWQAILAYLNKLKLGEDNLFECAEYTIVARRLSGLDLGPKATPAAVVKRALEQGLRLEFIDS